MWKVTLDFEHQRGGSTVFGFESYPVENVVSWCTQVSEYPVGAQTVGYADDVTFLVVKSTAGELERTANALVVQIVGWMAEHGLGLVAAKTEVVTGRRKYNNPHMAVDSHQIPISKCLKYLGVTLDTRLSYRKLLRTQVSARTTREALVVGRLMTNLDGPSIVKRLLLQTVPAVVCRTGVGRLRNQACLQYNANNESTTCPLLKPIMTYI